LAQGPNRPGRSPKSPPTLPTPTRATCSAKCVKGKRVSWACPPCTAPPPPFDEPLLPLSRSVKPESAPHPSVVDAQLPHPLLCLSPRSSAAVSHGRKRSFMARPSESGSGQAEWCGGCGQASRCFPTLPSSPAKPQLAGAESSGELLCFWATRDLGLE
jgi:hypothetical protein